MIIIKSFILVNIIFKHYTKNLRCCNRAQWEIRELAYKMLEQAKKVAPLLFKNAGASCVATGHCPEGAMTCGKFAEMIKMRED